ncbi:Acetyltransferase, GNAT family [Olavius sp. associated proteobacterium Delta 1]|nr:Acetyltransferase, GNAT family [Olavius sp. associated proteobacterium Delta 1]
MSRNHKAQYPDELPLGELVEISEPTQPAGRKRYEGRYVNLRPVDPQKDVADLYRNSHGSQAKNRIWTYMAYGPFSDELAMQAWLSDCKASSDPLFLTVTSKELSQCVGVVSFLNILSQMRCLELGNIWYSPIVHHTKINTETIYLMLSAAFDRLKYRRVEWKCDALNARSRTAALRLGFSFEGIFRQHYIIKGRNRDTAWFAMLDRDWPAVKSNMNRWLYSDENNISLAELNQPLLNAIGSEPGPYSSSAS